MPCITPVFALITFPPKIWPIHWCPKQTPNSGNFGPSFSTLSSDIPDSSGVPKRERERERKKKENKKTKENKNGKAQFGSNNGVSVEVDITLSACCNLPGPGETRIPFGFAASIWSVVTSSFLKTTYSHFKLPRYFSHTRQMINKNKGLPYVSSFTSA